MKAARRLLPALLALCLLLCGCTGDEAAAPAETGPAPAAVPARTPAPECPPYQELPVYMDGLLIDRGYVYEGTAFLSPEPLFDRAGLLMEYTPGPGGFTISAPGLALEAERSAEYLCANGRWFYTPLGCLETGGRVYLPAELLARLFSVSVSVGEDMLRADINSAGLSLLRGGENYYELNFPAEDFYWLSRIIYSETRDQPMAGLIGVGNVVLNRVASDNFPDTVFNVIFDRKGAVQFDPAADGSVLGEPDERSVIAACLCLEGYNTVGESLYFVNPDRGDGSWFEASLRLVISIGDHDFYM